MGLWSRFNGSAPYADLAAKTCPGYAWTASWVPGGERKIRVFGEVEKNVSDGKLINDVQDVYAAMTNQVNLALIVCTSSAATGRVYCKDTRSPSVFRGERAAPASRSWAP